MSCVVGVVKNGTVYLGGDSASVGDWTTRETKLSKVFISGDFLMGYVGSFRVGNLLQHKLHIDTRKEGMGDEEFMVVTFVENMRECLKEGGVSKIENNVERGGNLLVGYNGTLYEIDDDFQVNTFGEYNSIGWGFPFALGSLYMTSGKEPEERVRLALETAAHFCGTVIPPFKILKK